MTLLASEVFLRPNFFNKKSINPIFVLLWDTLQKKLENSPDTISKM